jgi:DNA invertase Pin-like site-specific DNA recombinase
LLPDDSTRLEDDAMRAALYARVSTSEEKELQDPELQINILKDYCRANGLEIVATYQDRGTGTTAEGRDEFQKMIAAAEAKEFEAVVLLRMDRFMRDAEEGMHYCKRLQKAECRLVLVKDPFLGMVDTSTPIGEFFLTLVFAMGNLERRQFMERSKEGIENFRKKNGWWGRGCPNPKPGKKGKRKINIDLAVELLKVRGSLSAVARDLGVPRSTLQDHLKRAGVEYETLTTCRNTPTGETDPSLNTEESGPRVPEYGRNTAGGE